MGRTHRAVPAVFAVLAALGMCAAQPQAGGGGPDPVALTRTGRVTDQVGALGDRAPQVRAALDALYAHHHLQLFVAYVSGFAGRSPQDWANATAVRSGLGRRDVLLAVATHDRRWAVSADQDAGLTQTQIAEVSDIAVEPALRENDWAGAAIGAADGYAAVLDGKPVQPPDVVPGVPDPGRASATSNGSADLWIPVVAVLAAAGVGSYAWRRRRTEAGSAAARVPAGRRYGRGRGAGRALPVTPLPELDSQARLLLVETDDAVRTSREDVGLAAAQCGGTAAAPFAEAVEYAASELTAAFRLRQGLDDAFPEDDGTRRQMLDEILSRCTQANRRLDAESEAFDRMRALEAGAGDVLELAEARAVALPGRVAAAGQALATLAARYAPAALGPLTGHPAEARDRLDFARSCLDRAHAALRTDRGRAAAFLRAAEGGLVQAAALADSVLRRERELRAAEEALREAAGQAPQEVGEQAAAGRYDPLGALRSVTEAAVGMEEEAPAGPGEAGVAVRRAPTLLGWALLTASSEVAAARDVVTAHRGGIGCRARTRLSESERLLLRAEALAAADPAAAREHAAAADRLARDAQLLALDDLAGYGAPGTTGRAGFTGEAAGRRADEGMDGAVLGGILLGGVPGGGGTRGGRAGSGGSGGFGGSAGFGGFGGDSGGLGGFDGYGAPGSFGGGRTRDRMGGGGGHQR
ncbi:TPM domain-containing protein [Streptomyces sp. HPF1205]|uniref:TPM domain-containing protein n=1 Tax=Streptomyces sp. HPF1205 TaxID=2873262 RepID=UPI001CED1DBA|nr:TPM domain-containing protein [Streptomyces sp. HPF1205]